MNKYSSKAVKTAATVGMSLAMVLGNVAPVLATTTLKVCETKEEGSYTKNDTNLSFDYTLVAEDEDADGTKLKTKLAELLKEKNITATVNNLAGTSFDGNLEYVDSTGKTVNNENNVSISVEVQKSADDKGEVTTDFKTGNVAVVTVTVTEDIINHDANKCKDYSDSVGGQAYLDVLSALGDEKFTNVTLDSDIKIENKADKKVNILIAIKEYEKDLELFMNSDEPDYKEKAQINTWLEVVDAIEELAGAGSLAEKDVVDGSTLAGYIANVNNEEEATDWSVIDDDNYGEAKEALKVLKDFKKDYGKYVGIDSEGDYVNDLAGAVQDTYVTLNDNINEYLGTTADSDLSDFVLAFDAILQNDLEEKTTDLTKKVSNDKDAKTIGQIVGKTEKELPAIKLNNKSQIKERMNMIKDHDNYDRFEEEDAVVAILDAYQELLDNIGTNADVFKSDEYNEYNKTKVAAFDGKKYTVKTFVNDVDKLTHKENDSSTAYKADEKADYLADTLNSDQWAILKAVKEEVMDSIYTMETRQVGNYYVDKSDYATTATNSQRNTFKNAFPEYLYTLVDKEEGLFGYDVVAAHMEDVATALKAVTTDIAKITPANIKATDKATLEAAEDAIFELTSNKGKYVDNLTSTEEKEVRSAESKIENLREAFDNLGTTTVAGWYDMGNGNWGYNNEDGTPAAYKWVASGSNWYFVKDGKMVRSSWLATDGGRWYYLDSEGKMVTNQSVDGCWINSYGVYMSPSYNG